MLSCLGVERFEAGRLYTSRWVGIVEGRWVGHEPGYGWYHLEPWEVSLYRLPAPKDACGVGPWLITRVWGTA